MVRVVGHHSGGRKVQGELHHIGERLAPTGRPVHPAGPSRGWRLFRRRQKVRPAQLNRLPQHLAERQVAGPIQGLRVLSEGPRPDRRQGARLLPILPGKRNKHATCGLSLCTGLFKGASAIRHHRLPHRRLQAVF